MLWRLESTYVVAVAADQTLTIISQRRPRHMRLRPFLRIISQMGCLRQRSGRHRQHWRRLEPQKRRHTDRHQSATFIHNQTVGLLTPRWVIFITWYSYHCFNNWTYACLSRFISALPVCVVLFLASRFSCI